MIKLFLLLAFLLMGSFSLKAEDAPGSDQEFQSELDNVKNPFEDGIPKPVFVPPPPPVVYKPVIIHRRRHIVPPVVTPPSLDLEGVIVGEGIQQAIIDDQVVPLGGTIKGAKVIAVEKQGVQLTYKGKKFFLKVD